MMLGTYKDDSGNIVTADTNFIPEGGNIKMVSYVDAAGVRHTATVNEFLATYDTTYPNGLNESI